MFVRQADKRLNVWNDEETNVFLDLVSQEEHAAVSNKMNYFDKPGLLFWWLVPGVRPLTASLAGLQNCGDFPWEIMGIDRESTGMYASEQEWTGTAGQPVTGNVNVEKTF